MPVSIGSSAVVAIAAPQKIAQAIGADSINRPNLNIGSQGERVSELQAALKLLGFYTGAVDGIYKDATANAVSQFKQAAGLNPDSIVDANTWQRLFPSEPVVASSTPVSQPKPTVVRTLNAPTQSGNVNRVVNSKPEPRPTKPRQTTTPRESKPVPTRITPILISERTPGIQYTAEGLPILRLGNRGSEVVKLQTQLQRLGFLKGGIDGDFRATTDAAVKALQTRYGLEADGVVGGATWEILLRRSR
ncbi:peptidoglycan-binding protein [Calothrix sp. PCC 7507]|uniref:peptidoglycan-binding protein n=1 Tax=Calothrix sp. PCC 7507 TaxID=99598 RepID=UPI00029ED8DB|nr:peptidoglycan-binding protein [Calothrix sp. PCC 7507]AFY31462.1 Peptidoglycan-binding domain 1 protein [Calothrix sp. PCC 7507]